MGKVYIVSLAFVPARIAIECMAQVYKTIGLSMATFEHHVLMQHYPISKQTNDELLLTLFKQYSCVVHDLGKNVGLSAGYTYLIQQLKLNEDDIVIGLDLDVNPVTPGWGEAIIKVLRADKKIGWLSLMNPHAKRELPERGFTTHTIADTICYEGHAPCVQSIIGWSGESLLALKEIKESNEWYGGGEVVNFPRLKAAGLKWMYMPQYEEAHSDLMVSDAPFRHYKWNLAHLRTTTLSFEEWLKQDPTRMELK